MKKELVILLFFLIPFVSSWDYQIEVDCENCFEGEFVNVTLQIVNDVEEEVNIRGVYLMDAENIDFYYSETSQTLLLDGSLSFGLSVQLPPPTRSETLFFRPCLLVDEGKSCSITNSRLRVKLISEIECFDDNDCDNGYSCEIKECLREKSNWFPFIVVLVIIGLILGIRFWPHKKKRIRF